MKQVTIITFSPVSAHSTGPGKLVQQLGILLHKHNCLKAIVCPSYNIDGLGLPEEKIVTVPSPFFLKIINKILSELGKYFNIRIRRYREMIFDYFVSKSHVLHSSEVVLFTKPIFKLSSAYCLGNDIRTIAFASILHPQFNNEIVKIEMKRLNVNEYSEYTDDSRTKSLTDFFKTVDHLLVQSVMVRNNFIKYGVDKEKVDVIDSSIYVDIDKYSKRNNKLSDDPKFRVLHISNMDLIKGVDYLLSAWSDANFDDAELLLGGAINQKISVVYNKHSENNVKTLGYIDDTAKLYSTADVFVSPSVSDLNPYTVLEAMACGVPVIVSDHCGISAFIDHKVDGLVYKYDDVNELKQCLTWCFLNRDKLKEMAKRSRIKAIKCSENDVKNSIYQYINKLE